MKQPQEKFLANDNYSSEEIRAFDQYLALFENRNLPLFLDESFLETGSIIEEKTIDTALVILFISENEKLAGGGNLFDYHKFSPIVKFYLSSSIIGVIYGEYGGAGGVDDQYFLHLYSISGEKKDFLLVGKSMGDLGYISQVTSVISQNKISLIYTEFQGYEDEERDEDNTDGYYEVHKEEKEYKIDVEHGKIELIGSRELPITPKKQKKHDE